MAFGVTYAEAAKLRQRAAGGDRKSDKYRKSALADLREPISRDEWASEQAAAAVALSQLCDRALSVRASTGEGRRRNLSQIRDRFLSVRTSTDKYRESVSADLREPMYAEAASKRVGGRPKRGEEKPRANLREDYQRSERRADEQAAAAVWLRLCGVNASCRVWCVDQLMNRVFTIHSQF